MNFYQKEDMHKNCTQFQKQSTFSCTAKELYRWHERAGALQRLLPPWEDTAVIERSGGLGAGGKTLLRLHLGIIPFTFEAKHIQAISGKMFEDHQEKGPFALWQHKHYFSDTVDGALMKDHVSYTLRAQKVLPAFVRKFAARALARTFHHRHTRLQHDILRHNQYSQNSMNILISGASGVLGRELIPFLTTGGHKVWTLVRRKAHPESNEIYWNPATGEIDTGAIPQIDAVIHLAGEYIGLGRWNKEKKEAVIKSRQDGTTLLAQTVANLSPKPKVFLSSSATGFYGSSKSKDISEEHPSGDGFMADVCREWEYATTPAREAGIRTVCMRMGVVLSAKGGALHRLLQIAPLGFPKSFGSGEQFTSWISVDDLVSATLHCLHTNSVKGPVNIAAPTPVTNAQLIATLAQLTKRPILPPVPTSFLTTFYGEMAHEIALASCHVSSKKLEDSGFIFSHNHLEDAIRSQLGIYPIMSL